jgi:hypothetical protein
VDEQVVQEIVDEVLSSLEPRDTQGAALVQFLKAKGIAGDEELAPYLKQAENASNVRWMAARVRIKSLISSAMKEFDTKPAETNAEEKKSTGKKSANRNLEVQETADLKESAKNSNQMNHGREKEGSGEPSKTAKTDQDILSEEPALIAERGKKRRENKATESDAGAKEKAS